MTTETTTRVLTVLGLFLFLFLCATAARAQDDPWAEPGGTSSASSPAASRSLLPASPPTSFAVAGPESVVLGVFVDRSISAKPFEAEQEELVREAIRALGPGDSAAVYGFSGVLGAGSGVRAVVGGGGDPFAEELLDSLGSPDGKVTFYTSVFHRGLQEVGSVPPPARRVVVVITDAEGSDPLNERADSRTAVDDPSWRDRVPDHLADTPIIWAIFGDPGDLPEGAVKRAAVHPDGAALVLWNAPAGWSAPSGSLTEWVRSFRPEPVPLPAVVETPAEVPGPSVWERHLLALLGLFGACLVLALGYRRYRAAAQQRFLLWRDAAEDRTRIREEEERREQQRRTRELAQRRTDRKRAATLRRTTNVTLIPLWHAGVEPQQRSVTEGAGFDVGPSAGFDGVHWPQMPCNGFRLQRQDGEVQIAPKGISDCIVLQRDYDRIEVRPGRSASLADGDVIATAGGLRFLKVEVKRPAGAGRS